MKLKEYFDFYVKNVLKEENLYRQIAYKNGKFAEISELFMAIIDNNFNKKKIFVLNDVRDAFPLMNRLADKNTYVLLENDLPDLFNE